MSKKVSNIFHATSKKVGMAIADYQMLAAGDKILVAISGGKDSLSLLKLMAYRKQLIPVDIELMAVHIDMGAPTDCAGLRSYLDSCGVPWRMDTVSVLKEGQTWDDMSCFWCAWNRRKALFQLAGQLGFNKIALGHHMDDIIETVLLNLFYQGETSTMLPKQALFQGKITLIRPLAYLQERDLQRFVEKEGLPVFDDFDCPHNDDSKRQMIKQMLAGLAQENKHVKKNILKGVSRKKQEYMLTVPDSGTE